MLHVVEWGATDDRNEGETEIRCETVHDCVGNVKCVREASENDERCSVHAQHVDDKYVATEAMVLVAKTPWDLEEEEEKTYPHAEIMKKYIRAHGMQNTIHFPPRRETSHSQKVPDMAATKEARKLGRHAIWLTARVRTSDGFVVVATGNGTHKVSRENRPTDKTLGTRFVQSTVTNGNKTHMIAAAARPALGPLISLAMPNRKKQVRTEK